MNVKKVLAVTAASAAFISTIGFAYAQSTTPNRNADGTMNSGSQSNPNTPGNSGMSGNTGSTTPNSSASTPNSSGSMPNNSGTGMGSSGTMSGDQSSTSAGRLARADRN
jgi:hypothetical protein